jgi:hypothetical protein
MATKYHRVGLDLSGDQMHKLGRGMSVSVRPGQHIVHMTKAQKTKLAAAHKLGKTASVKLSKAALDHNRVHGSGLFGNILKTVARAALPFAAKTLGNVTGSKAVGDIAGGIGDAALTHFGAGFGRGLRR